MRNGHFPIKVGNVFSINAYRKPQVDMPPHTPEAEFSFWTQLQVLCLPCLAALQVPSNTAMDESQTQSEPALTTAQTHEFTKHLLLWKSSG